MSKKFEWSSILLFILPSPSLQLDAQSCFNDVIIDIILDIISYEIILLHCLKQSQFFHSFIYYHIHIYQPLCHFSPVNVDFFVPNIILYSVLFFLILFINCLFVWQQFLGICGLVETEETEDVVMSSNAIMSVVHYRLWQWHKRIRIYFYLSNNVTMTRLYHRPIMKQHL